MLFPEGFAAADPPKPPEEPEAPEIPMGASTWPMSVSQMAALAAPSPIAMPSRLTFDPRPLEPVFDASAPDYEQLADGGLSVSYGTQTIRHDRRSKAGDPIELVCESDGEFVVEWRIHAANLIRPRHGAVKLTVEFEKRGDPIAVLQDLREVLGTAEDLFSDEDLEARVGLRRGHSSSAYYSRPLPLPRFTRRQQPADHSTATNDDYDGLLFEAFRNRWSSRSTATGAA